ncbi:hypothetical protein AAC387_Pa04g1997 [Persea americana]
MGDAISPPGAILSAISDTALDIDLMDDLLLGGCWLETAQSHDLFQHGTSTSAAFLNSSCFSIFDINISGSNPNPPQSTAQEDLVTSVLPECTSQLESYPATGGRSLDDFEKVSLSSDVSRRWWIEPGANLGPTSSVKERLKQALGYIKEFTKDSDVLVQIWVPVNRGGRHVLTTHDQPFSLDTSCQKLVNYRTVSMNYEFPADKNSNEAVGLPGRVYLGRLPEWAPDVRYFSSYEYPRIDYAQQIDVRGTLALPVFERGSPVCLGVVEVVMTKEKIKYHSELESICSALQAVNLRSSEVVTVPRLKVSNNSYQVVLPEILEVLRAVCESHRLPLAQTWVPCIQQGKKGSRHSDENYAVCVSTVDGACYVADPHICGFHEACSEHHLVKGQGVVGKAFTTNQPCFSEDITAFSLTQYPLSHYARMFRLRAAVAIRLRSVYTGTADYVLEFFLPIECLDSEEQKMMLSSLSMILQQVCQSLQVVTDKELEDESVLRLNQVVPSVGVLTASFSGDDGRQNQEKNPTKGQRPNSVQAQQKGKTPMVSTMPLECQTKATDGFNVRTHWDCPEGTMGAGEIFPELKLHYQDSVKDSVRHGDSSFSELSISNAGKVTSKRRTKIEKSISLQVLRQYFAGSLKDAAKSIGVCPTTLKRICRQHGITRWPSRKIKKVGHSLKKLQVVIDSVQGVGRDFHISSFYENFPLISGSNLTSPKLSGRSTLSGSKQPTGPPASSNMHPEDVLGIHTAPTRSPSSTCSQSSNSSLCCSTGVPQHSRACQVVASEDTSMVEKESAVLKKAYSEAELLAFTKDEQKPPARSLSHISLSEHPSLDSSLSPLPKASCHRPTDGRSFKVKVMYKDDKVRFRMQPSWGFQDLQQEIAKRFNIDAVSTFDLKYLDDDSEWVLLTCDDDLQECRDIYKSACAHAIKLSVHHIVHPTPKNSLGHSNDCFCYLTKLSLKK